eukprot:gene6271-12701_t
MQSYCHNIDEAQIKICSWNINGIKSLVNLYGTLESIQQLLLSHIICFQETKLTNRLNSALFLSENYYSFFSLCRPLKPYSGTATFVRKDIPVIRAQEGLTGLLSASADDKIVTLSLDELSMSEEEAMALDKEGRCVITDHGCFVLINVYAPNATANDEIDLETESGTKQNAVASSSSRLLQQKDDRFVFKMKFHHMLSTAIITLRRTGHAVILAGDLNATSSPLDDCCECETVPAVAAAAMATSSTAAAAATTLLTATRRTTDMTLTDNRGGGDPHCDDSVLNTSSYMNSPNQWLSRLLRGGSCTTTVDKNGHNDGDVGDDDDNCDSINQGMTDTFRLHHKDRQFAYTCWSTYTGARKDVLMVVEVIELKMRCFFNNNEKCFLQTNFGCRLDYILVSEDLKRRVIGADILPEIFGSDHCPTYATLRFNVSELTRQKSLLSQITPLPTLCSVFIAGFVTSKQTKIMSFLREKEPNNNSNLSTSCQLAELAIELETDKDLSQIVLEHNNDGNNIGNHLLSDKERSKRPSQELSWDTTSTSTSTCVETKSSLFSSRKRMKHVDREKGLRAVTKHQAKLTDMFHMTSTGSKPSAVASNDSIFNDESPKLQTMPSYRSNADTLRTDQIQIQNHDDASKTMDIHKSLPLQLQLPLPESFLPNGSRNAFSLLLQSPTPPPLCTSALSSSSPSFYELDMANPLLSERSQSLDPTKTGGSFVVPVPLAMREIPKGAAPFSLGTRYFIVVVMKNLKCKLFIDMISRSRMLCEIKLCDLRFKFSFVTAMK